MGPLFLGLVAGLASATAEHAFRNAGRKNSPGGSSVDTNKRIEKMDETSGDEGGGIGADDIYVSGESEVGAARSRARPAATKPAFRRIAFITQISIAAAATLAVPITLNHAFKGLGIRLSGTNQDKLLFNGASIRGNPQEASSGSVGCELFTHPGETYFWEWETANPGESFTLSFTNTHSAAVTPTGYLVGYLA